MIKCIQQQRNSLSKQPSKLEILDDDNEVNLTKALNPGSYSKTGLGDMAKNCTNLTIEQQTRLLSMLKHHSALVEGK
jgi:hypothetical protein